MDIQKIKQRFGIIGNSEGLNRAIDVAAQVSPTDLSVLITGESGTGKEVFPQIIHNFSSRKHGKYIPVNCGAIPDGTIDSELFGHEKGSFTGAHDSRKGYFEEANNGTIFLDEVAELPLSTQVRLLRVLESGEFFRVGSSSVQKTNVRVIAATNVDIIMAIEENKFREDLYYRLNTVPIIIPPLKEREGDIYLLFRKFANDFAERYRMPSISLGEEARRILDNYEWPGNVRQLKNITEQLSVIETQRVVTEDVIKKYLPDYYPNKLPALYKDNLVNEKTFASEREILYKILFDMKSDLNNVKKLVHEFIDKGTDINDLKNADQYIQNIQQESSSLLNSPNVQQAPMQNSDHNIEDTEEFVEESLSLQEKEVELIRKALDRHKGKRKYAAQDLGISERTLYRKIKEYDID
ncbi:MAG: sigma-54 dependent transcriptional regulator [Bacteroidales bacterium]|jgi:transcriptional regulator with PAS, ATPase and Fis domain|nr:sigma-54 dependent transcriptional regulator [Bacteroidales bacterium]